MSKKTVEPRFSQSFLLSLFYANCCTFLECLRQNSVPNVSLQNSIVEYPVTVTKLRTWISQEIYPALKEALTNDSALMRQVATDKERVEDLFATWSNGLFSAQQNREIEELTTKFSWLSTTYANHG